MQFSATPSWTVPIISMSCRLVSSSLTMLYWPRKCDDTAMSASFGQRLNQSIVQPEIRPGNFSDRLRNFSPTCRRKVAVSSTVRYKPIIIKYAYYTIHVRHQTAQGDNGKQAS